jgi:hypothetical protein
MSIFNIQLSRKQAIIAAVVAVALILGVVGFALFRSANPVQPPDADANRIGQKQGQIMEEWYKSHSSPASTAPSPGAKTK